MKSLEAEKRTSTSVAFGSPLSEFIVKLCTKDRAFIDESCPNFLKFLKRLCHLFENGNKMQDNCAILFFLKQTSLLHLYQIRANNARTKTITVLLIISADR